MTKVPSADKETLSLLETKLTEAGSSLPKVTGKKMFGCHALWVNGNVFALVWKHGRIGVKLPDEASYKSLMALDGAEPWKAGPMQMAHWVLVPTSFHAKGTGLKKWVTKAHGLCSVLEKKATKTPSIKKSSKKR